MLPASYQLPAAAVLLFPFVPTLVAAWRRKEVGLALRSLPGFFVLRIVNGFFMLRALFSEFVLRRTLTVYEKGH